MDKRYRFSKPHNDPDIQQIQREIQDNMVSFDRDGNIVIDADITCVDLITSGDSIYIGSKKKKNKLNVVADELYYNEIKITHSDQDELLDPTGVGIAPHASIHESGGYDEIGRSVVAKTATYTITTSDDIITCGAGNQTFTVSLPTPATGKIYYIKNVGTGLITVDADAVGSTTIDGDTTQPVAQDECLEVVADASVYWSI